MAVLHQMQNLQLLKLINGVRELFNKLFFKRLNINRLLHVMQVGLPLWPMKSIDLAQYLNMLKGSTTQNLYGITESINIKNISTCTSITSCR